MWKELLRKRAIQDLERLGHLGFGMFSPESMEKPVNVLK